MTTETFYGWLADAILIVHFAFVAFVVLGLAVIWIGYFLKREFVRNFWFRLAHLLAMAVVVIESVFHIVCPLTTWENQLRVLAGAGAYQGSFVQHWVHKWMFFRLPPATFTMIYVAFFTALILSFVLIRPRLPRRRRSAGDQSAQPSS